MIRLVVGLGNPGPRYQGTRHNVGFLMADRAAEARGASWRPWKGLGEVAQAEGPGRPLYLAKPTTFMNFSGRMVGAFSRQKGIAPDEILVCFDDIALPVGALRLRARGSAGGQKGMASVIEALGTEEIPRLRLGIGPVPPDADAAEYVLARFRPSERGALSDGLVRASEALDVALEKGLEAAMNAFNART